MSLQPPQQYTARLAEKIVLNHKFEQYTFELVEPNKLEFQAGQYISFAVSDQGHRRSWSISSSPAITHSFEIVIDPAPQGMGTKFLQNLKPGDEVQLLAPMGQFTINDSGAEESIALVATGVGIAPFLSMIDDLFQVKKDTRPIALYWGLRHIEDMMWQNDFQELAEEFPNFRFHPVISQATSEWPLCRGRVTDCLSIHQLPVAAGFYLCGKEQMIEDVKNQLLGQQVVAERIHYEKFY